MNKLAIKIKRAVRKWLGLGEAFMGVDMAASSRDQSCIVIVSRLNGGTVRIIDCRFVSVRDIEHLVQSLQQHYGIPNGAINWDIPPGLKRRAF